MTGQLLDLIDLFSSYHPRTPDELLEAGDLIRETIAPMHALLAVPLLLSDVQATTAAAWKASQKGHVPYLPAASTAVSTSTATTTNNYIIGPAYQGMGGYISNASLAYQGGQGVSGGNVPGASQLASTWSTSATSTKRRRLSTAVPAQGRHVYLLPDGSKIEIDGRVGNYAIRRRAKITYKAARMREFNPFVNASDQIGNFIGDLGKLGANQQQAMHAPLEMFLRWLIAKAAEHDGEEVPADVPPVTVDQVRILPEHLTEPATTH